MYMGLENVKFRTLPSCASGCDTLPADVDFNQLYIRHAD